VRTPGYKDEYRDGAGGWAVEKGHPPKPTGCAWLRFIYDANTKAIKVKVEMDVD
jgi:hypothetical protein